MVKTLNITLLIVLSIIMVNCGPSYEEVQIEQVKNGKAIKSNNGKIFDIIIIDSCEYVVYDFGINNAIMSHKGNCKFCLKRK